MHACMHMYVCVCVCEHLGHDPVAELLAREASLAVVDDPRLGARLDDRGDYL